MSKVSAATAPSPERAAAFEAKRMDILHKAALAFAADGYHQTSVNSLAARLGVSKPVLYYYAKNKDDLLFQIGQVAREALQEAMSDAKGAQVSAMAKLRRFFTTYSGIMCGDFGRCFALVDPQALAEPARQKDLNHRRRIEESVRQLIIDGQADGSVRPCDPVLTARALFGAFNGLPRWFDSSGPLSPRDVADNYMDIFITGIGRG
jgi:AcrR family transcriptional regulator